MSDFEDDKQDKHVQIICEMFEQRNYTDIKQDEQHIYAKDENKQQIIAFIKVEKDLTDSKLKEFITKMQKNNHILIVCENPIPTSSAQKLLKQLSIGGKIIEVFSKNELQYNITKHRLQPKFSKISSEDLGRFNPGHLAILLHTKPISRFYRYLPGDIIRVERNDGTVIYRVVR